MDTNSPLYRNKKSGKLQSIATIVSTVLQAIKDGRLTFTNFADKVGDGYELTSEARECIVYNVQHWKIKNHTTPQLEAFFKARKQTPKNAAEMHCHLAQKLLWLERELRFDTICSWAEQLEEQGWSPGALQYITANLETDCRTLRAMPEGYEAYNRYPHQLKEHTNLGDIK